MPPEPEVLMLDATDIKAHPTASSLNKGGCPPPDKMLAQQGIPPCIPPRRCRKKPVHYSKRL